VRPRRRHTGITVGIIAGTLAFLAVIQVRSQAEVARSLQTQDNTSLAFLIDDLHVANDQLAIQVSTLTQQKSELEHGGSSPVPALTAELQRLQLAEGLLGAHGPGVVLRADAPLSAIDLQDAVNNLRFGGAEAISINGQRVICGSQIVQRGDRVTIDGVQVTGPWTVEAIGGPGALQPAAQAMVSSLRADPHVRSVSYEERSDLRIDAVVRQRPLVYGTP
jgi:uncharacterized protein YlxW (UPF0749 family)